MDHFLSARFKFASLKAKKSKINGSLKVCNALWGIQDGGLNGR